MKISVCMATYNGENYISEQIKSILNQIGNDDEVIISDDYSTDDTIKILVEFKDNRIKIFFNDYQKGYTKNFENAIKNASGDVIFLSDQDDIWVEGKVEKMLNKLQNSDIVVSNAEIVNSKLETIHPSHFQLNNVKQGFWLNLLKTRYIGACMAFKRDILKKALPFPKNQAYCAHDYWLTIVGEAFYRLELEDEPLIKYRRHANNASSGGNKNSNSIFKKLAVRIYCMFNLMTRITK